MASRSSPILRLAAFLLLTFSVSARAQTLVTLPGHVPRQVRSAVNLGSVPANEVIGLSLIVQTDQNLLDSALAQIYAQPLNQRHYLTPDQFAQKFDLADKRQKIKDFAQANGLTVDSARDNPNSLVVRVSGTAAQIEQAFHIQINRYRGPDGRIFRAHGTEPQIPADLAQHLSAVLGLSNAVVMHPHVRHPRYGAGPITPQALVSAAKLSPRCSGSSDSNQTICGSGPGAGLAPSDIKTIYGLSGSLNGSGQTIAIYELDGYNPTDIAAYQSQFGLTGATITFVSTDGVPNKCGPNQSDPCNATTLNGGQSDEGGQPDDGMTEVALDIELALALAPHSHLLVYTAYNSGSDPLSDYGDIQTADSASVVSTSWGVDQYDEGASGMGSENTIFETMATQGQSVYAAAGDHGAYDYGGNNSSLDSTLMVDDPASQPYVTGVGGTSLSGTVGGSVTETVWNNTPGCSSISCEAGGGGIANYVSGYWSLPSYQNGISQYSSSNQLSASNRNVPDIALNSDVNDSPYAVYVGGNWYYIGGTSAATPLWAALTALINQQRSSLGYTTTLGFPNAALYPLAESSSHNSFFNDVTSGSNGYYSATTGYDDASGWGSFKANALINAINTPGTVSNIAATTLGTSSISWTWSAALNASTYDIYNGTSASELLTNVSVTQYTRTSLPSDTTTSIVIAAVNSESVQGSTVASGVAATLAAAPPAPSPAVYVTSAVVAYSCAGSCSGYELEVSTAANFSGVDLTSATSNGAQPGLAVSGLTSGTLYFLRLDTLNELGAANEGPEISTRTQPAAPSAAASVFSDVAISSIAVNWSSSGEPSQVLYTAQISTDNFNSVNASSITYNAFAIFGTGGAGNVLVPATTYYFRVQASTVGQVGVFSDLGSTVTLAEPPVSFILTGVWSSSMTLQWSANGNPAGTLYAVDYWQAVGSTQAYLTASTTPVLSGLAEGATYFLTVGGLNAGNVLAASGIIQSTVTLTQPVSPSVIVTSTGGLVSIYPPSGLITLQVPAGALPESTTVTLQIPSSYPSAPSAAGNLSATGLGVEICGAGANCPAPTVEPTANTTLSIAYAPYDVQGLNPSEFVIARYDPVDNLWVPLVSSVDTAGQVVTGITSHWSLFQVMQNAPASQVQSALAYPNPWRISQGPATMTFSQLPAGARLRIYTISGLIVKNLTADASGMSSWDGTNESGRAVASGFYFLFAQGSGGSKTLKLAVQR